MTHLTFGEKLRLLREEKNEKQIIVAKNLSCSANMISYYELDKREPDLTMLTKLCDYYDVSADFLLNRTKHMQQYHNSGLSQMQMDLLAAFDTLPQKYKEDILRITKLHCSQL